MFDRSSALGATIAALMLLGCGAEREITRSDLTGTWRAVLASPGGELPFKLRIIEKNGRLEAVAINGEEEAPFSSVAIEGDQVILDFNWYDSRIRAASGPDRELRGEWTKTAPEGESRLEFTAYRDDERRFVPPIDSAPRELYSPETVDGVWEVEFEDEDGVQPARGELRQEGETVRGTFLTPTGDYRYLEGDFRDGTLRLSTFDGAHAFLFRARAHSDGSLTGDFWSRDSYHATWTARRTDAGGEPTLPDAWELVGLTNDEGLFRFAFPDLEGNLVSSTDERFAGKAVLVNIFGSWCPNCNDEAPLLAEWHRRYADQGLEIVGLAYEFTGDAKRDRELVRRYAERHGIEYPLLLAGTSDKTDAAATLPDLTAVIAYPTSIFIGRDGRVRRIHSGFAGPGTGEHHDALVLELESLIERILGESGGP